MPRAPRTPTNIPQLLEHVHSLRVVSAPDQISLVDANALMDLGYLRQCWINNYSLTPAGERARRGQK